ncbi:MAG: hypothetical protein AAF415_19215 [Pseudomonadota bacterium]
MSRWHPLTPQDWSAHPLNGFGGGMRWVVGWIGFQSILAVLIVVMLALAPQELFDPAIPDGFEWVQWIFLALGPPVVLWLLFRRDPLGPVLYGGYFFAALAFPFYAEVWSPFLTSAETYVTQSGLIGAGLFAAFTIIDLLALGYLFLSDRANVLLRNRQRA